MVRSLIELETQQIKGMISELLKKLSQNVCSFAYLKNNSVPKVCFMGYAYDGENFILHTDLDSEKWKDLKNMDCVSLCMGTDCYHDYLELTAKVEKIHYDDIKFNELEKLYLGVHPQAINYKRPNKNGILILSPVSAKYAKTIEFDVDFFINKEPLVA